jgi:uncharacterized protein (DUF779 family)
MVSSSFICPADAARAARRCASGGAIFRPGAQDVLLGEVEGCPFHVGAPHYDYRAPFVDVTEHGGDSFSLEAADGVRFTVQSRPLTGADKVGKYWPGQSD